jgi:hypothetical protein
MSHVEMTIEANDAGEHLQLMSAALAGQTETVAAHELACKKVWPSRSYIPWQQTRSPRFVPLFSLAA